MRISGKITDKLASIFKPGDRAYNPGRPADVPPPKKAKPLPKGVEGHSLGGRKKRGSR